jgi:hypothetical protein
LLADGNYAYLAVTTPAQMQRLGIGWSLKLTGESGYLIALLLGLAIANFAPSLARWLGEAARPEFYIKTAIVILGGFLAVKAAEQLSHASTVMVRGVAAIIEAYLIYWASFISLPASGSVSRANGRRRSLPASPSAASRLRSPPPGLFARDHWCPSWSPHSSSSLPWWNC